MCESHAYLVREGKAELYMENVTSLVVENGWLRLTDLLGEESRLDASVQEIDFTGHRILLAPAAEPQGLRE